MELLLQTFLNLRLGHRLITMGRQQTACSGKDSSLAIAFDGATFEYKIEAIHVFTFYLSLVVDSAINGIIEFCSELLSPAVELEVKQSGVAFIIYERDEAMIASPSVIRWLTNNQ